MQKQLVCGDRPPSAARGHGSYRFCTSGLLSPRPTQDPSSRHPERRDPSSPRAARSPPSLGCTPRSCPEAWRPPGLTLGPGTEVTVAAAAAAHSGLAGGAAGDPRSQAQKPVGSRGPCVRASGLAHRQTLLAGRRTPTEKRGTAGSEATSQGRGSYLRPLQRREAFAAGGARAAAALVLGGAHRAASGPGGLRPGSGEVQPGRPEHLPQSILSPLFSPPSFHPTFNVRSAHRSLCPYEPPKPFSEQEGKDATNTGNEMDNGLPDCLSPDRREESLPQRDAPACVPGGACPRQGRLRTGSSDGSLFGSCRSSSAGDLKGFSASLAPRPRRAVSASSRTSGVRIF